MSWSVSCIRGAVRGERYRELDGPATRAIISKAKAIDAELVVVATRAKTGGGRAILRSVAEDVVQSAPCSVLVVRSPVTRAS